LLYHRLFSSQEPEFVSEPKEVQQALATVSQALSRLKEHKTVTWLLDSGFDDVAVWRTLWEQQEHLVVRLYHTDRTVAFQDRQGEWHQGDIAQATAHLRPLARVETTLEVKRGKQVRPKKQPVPVELAACPLRISYWSNVRRKGQGKLVTREVWLVQVRVLGVDWEPWLLLTDWPVTDAQSAARIFTMYRQRWSVEDAFKFLKTCLGWEEVQLLDLRGIRTLVALGWVAAGFLFDLGVSFDWVEVQLLAKLGGWEPHKGRTPGKLTLQRGLGRLLEMLATEAMLSSYATQHQGLPPKIAALLEGWQPPGDLCVDVRRKRYAPCHHLTVFSYLFENCCNLFPSFPLHARHSTALQSKKLLLSCSFPAESHLRSGYEPASRVHFREITSESIFYCKGY
jgi:hypothetical protein